MSHKYTVKVLVVSNGQRVDAVPGSSSLSPIS
jgi:hypothetical protein